MVSFEERQNGNVCAICLKQKRSNPKKIGKNKQNDEKISKSKIYKVFDKNILEKRIKITILITVKGFEFLHRKFINGGKHK